MNSTPPRLYRKNLKLHGLIYMDEKEQEVTVQNLSITGALVRLNENLYGDDIKHIFNVISASVTIDLYVPELEIAGEAEIVRVDTAESDHIVLALEFKSLAYYVDSWQYQRKAYRKYLSDIGRILLNGAIYEFVSINASVQGLMIRLAESITVAEGAIAKVEFNRLGLKGEVKVIWVDELADTGTLIGLQYLNIQKADIKGVPRFHK
ncbi:MAG: PilZ domain-containing protein [Methylovulum sp.]|nr:PilZ domain-containing protein [Methylovulum sp.]